MNTDLERDMSLFSIAVRYDLLDEDWDTRQWNLIRCPNPQHEDERASCAISENGFKCFSCGVSGGEVKFASLLAAKIANKTEINELDGLLLMAEVELDNPQEKKNPHFVSYVDKVSPLRVERNRHSSEIFFQNLLRPNWFMVKNSYLKRRGFTSELLTDVDVRMNFSSYYPFVFPIYCGWQFRGYVARTENESDPVRYSFNKGFPKSNIVGCPAQNLERGEVLVVEGYLDALKAYQFGYKNVCCLFGWHISEEQIEVIREYATSLIWATDQDEYGEEGYKRAKEIFTDMHVKRFCSSDYKDIAAIQVKSEFWQFIKNCR